MFKIIHLIILLEVPLAISPPLHVFFFCYQMVKGHEVCVCVCACVRVCVCACVCYCLCCGGAVVPVFLFYFTVLLASDGYHLRASDYRIEKPRKTHKSPQKQE